MLESVACAVDDAREKAEKKASAIIQEGVGRKQNQVDKVFTARKGFEAAVLRAVVPAIVKIDAPGREGCALSVYPEWFIANSHVLRDPTVVQHASFSSFSSQSKYSSEPLGSDCVTYIRKLSKYTPDIAVIHREKTTHSACLALWPVMNEVQSGTLTFCIDPYASPEHQIKLLERQHNHDSRNNLLLRYQCKNTIPPQPGCSGTPVIEARVIMSRSEPVWIFCVVGMIFARWKSDHSQVIVVPIAEDLTQILAIIQQNEQSQRSMDMAKACLAINDDRQSEQYVRASIQQRESALLQEKCYSAGLSSLVFSPGNQDLELLWYSRIVKVYQSLLIRGVLVNELGKKIARTKPIDGVSVNSLLNDFQLILRKIRQLECITFIGGQAAETYVETDYFRLDIEGGTNGPWLLSIEDNISHKGQRLTHLNKALSSVFAIVKVPQHKKNISGKLLGDLVEKSQELCKAAVIEYLSDSRNITVKQNGKKHTKTSREFTATIDDRDKWVKNTTHVNSQMRVR